MASAAPLATASWPVAASKPPFRIRTWSKAGTDVRMHARPLGTERVSRRSLDHVQVGTFNVNWTVSIIPLPAEVAR